MSDAAKLAWMLIYLGTCMEYIQQHHPDAFSDSGLKYLKPEYDALAPIIDKLKDEK